MATTHTVTQDEAVSPTDLFSPVVAGAPTDDVAARLMAATLGSMELSAVYLGDRLGWYRALAEYGALTSTELARTSGTAERYAREWLEHQGASGYLEVLDPAVPADERRFALGPGAREVLTDVDSTAHVAPLARMQAASGRVLDQLVDAYRTGGGVSWADLGADAREAQAAFNRPYFLHELTQRSLPAAPDLHARLVAGARVADVGCGEGWSSIGLALGYPEITVDGYDVDEPSIRAGRRHVSTSGVADRVTLWHDDAAQIDGSAGHYDVVTAFECVHDLSDPVGVLRAMRAMAAPGAYVLVVDEATEERFAARSGPVERLLYGFSLLICLPDGLSRAGGAGTGTVMRPDVLRDYAVQAGFSDVEVLPVEHDLFRFYRLHL